MSICVNSAFLVKIAILVSRSGACVGDQPHSKRDWQPLPRPTMSLGELVTGEYNLFVVVEEHIEGVEKFPLRALLANEKLRMSDQDDIILAIAVPKVVHFVVTQGTTRSLRNFSEET
jgi:hypothetical protein